jgi:hypothetical protein
MVRVGPVPLSLGLQHGGGDQVIRRGDGEDCKQRRLTVVFTSGEPSVARLSRPMQRGISRCACNKP